MMPIEFEHLAEWHIRGKCASDADNLDWIEPKRIRVHGTEADVDAARRMTAAAMCSGCPVIDLCRQEVLDNNETDLIKAGEYLGADGDGRTHRAHNRIREALGQPYQTTPEDKLVAEGWPAPCSTCGTPMRMPPYMNFADYPSTTLCANKKNMQCYNCTRRERKENS